ncbi:MAG: dTDP-4-dehydrorhamnose 3,5-epimerase [Thermodesulfobacteriota bacterium]|nr:dTDP-4-dehydrorhamnose 3,5-epimerase [Thermodesulfobacteriota bacterium]
MGAIFEKTDLDGVILVKPDVFRDSRGFFLETWQKQRYSTGKIDCDFVQDNHSRSAQGVVRGLHYQLVSAQDKLVYAVRGTIFDVAVDIRKNSPSFGRWTGQILSEENQYQLFIPKGFAHGFSVLSRTADVMYKCSDYYAPGDEYGILFNDEDLNIDWKIETPEVSEKDRRNPALADMDPACLPK